MFEIYINQNFGFIFLVMKKTDKTWFKVEFLTYLMIFCTTGG